MHKYKITRTLKQINVEKKYPRNEWATAGEKNTAGEVDKIGQL